MLAQVERTFVSCLTCVTLITASRSLQLSHIIRYRVHLRPPQATVLEHQDRSPARRAAIVRDDHTAVSYSRPPKNTS